MTGMRWLPWLGLAAALASAACTDDSPEPGLDAHALVDRLTALGVDVDPAVSPDGAPHGDYLLHVTQPIDHDHPEAGTFQQKVSLIHRSTGPRTPMIVFTTGYDDYWNYFPSEPTELLDGNQVSIEYRYFGDSAPAIDPATGARDWSKLTIAQAAADEHAIITLLKQVYDGPFITAGPSKGGMTATYHRRFYPDDVAGTVAYVAPLSLGEPDPRYQAFLATAGTADCHDHLHQLVIEMLGQRRAALEALVADRLTGTGVPAGPALDDAVRYLEWGFWQYHGVSECAALPPIDAADVTLFHLIDEVNPLLDNADPAVLARGAIYNFQANYQLGFPDEATHDLDPFVQFPDGVALPTPDPGFVPPAYDPSVMPDIQDFVANDAEHMLFIYGQFDPWSAGAYQVNPAHDSAKLVVTGGNHGSEIFDLEPKDRAHAFAMLKAWTGVDPDPGRVQERQQRARLIRRDPMRFHGRLP